MQRFRGLITLVLAALLGAALITLPPYVLDQYEQVRQYGQGWAYAYLAALAVGALLLLGAVGYGLARVLANTRQVKEKRRKAALRASEMKPEETRELVSQTIEEAQTLAAGHEVDAHEREAVEHAVRDVQKKLDTRTLEIVAFGTVSSGKSALLNALIGQKLFESRARGGTTIERRQVDWPTAERVTLVDTPGLSEAGDRDHAAIARESARNADLVLFVVDGPLKDTEFAVLRVLHEMDKRLLVCLNKSDWYEAEDLGELLDQIREQVAPYVAAEDVTPVRAQPAQRPVVRVLADGSEVREMREVEPDVTPLARRMLDVVQRDGTDLLLANLLLQSRAVLDQAKQTVQSHVDERAHEIVNRYMWRAGTAAAITPIPAADLAIALGVSTKMVHELSKVYRQPIDLPAIGKMIEQLPAMLGPLAGAHLVTPFVAGVIASSAKAVPGVGTLAGGLLQGLTQTLMTKWIGRIFIVYFRNEMTAPTGSLADLAREKWDEVTRRDELLKLVRTGLTKLGETKKEEK